MEKRDSHNIGDDNSYSEEQASEEIVRRIISATKKSTIPDPPKAQWKWARIPVQSAGWIKKPYKPKASPPIVYPDTYRPEYIQSMLKESITRSQYHVLQVPFQQYLQKFVTSCKTRLPKYHLVMLTQHPKGTYILLKAKRAYTPSQITKLIPSSTHLHLGNKGQSAIKKYDDLKRLHPIGNTDRFTFLI